MGQFKPLFEPLERMLDAGGTRKDIAFLVISAISLILSFALPATLPVDPAWVAIILCGLPIVIEAAIALLTEFDIKADVLVSIALIASICIGEYFAAGEVAVIMQLGGLLEELTVARAQAGIQRLVELTPRTARIVLADGSEQEVRAEDVELNARVRILPGETVPVDGIIVSGTTSIDESVVTGEPMPRDKQEGDEVAAGTVNQFGAIEVRATRVGEDGSIQRMARLVASADAGKAKIVRLADRWATWVVAGALAAAIGVYLFTGEILRSVTVLVVFCPCSLVLATPTAIVAAIGNATKHGFLVKEGDALERLDKTDYMIFDKTGTITEGKPRVNELCPTEEAKLSRTQLYRLLASAELRSEHPLGKAIVACARQEGIELTEPESFEMLPGQGVAARIEDCLVHAGNERLMSKLRLNADSWKGVDVASLLARGGTVTYIAVNDVPAGVVVLSDTTRKEASAAINQLKAQGVTPILLTGDNEVAAATVAANVGIEKFQASCRPDDKLNFIEQQENAGHLATMVGDGINDAPALKRACVGVAIGGVGSDIAVDAADIAIIDGRISELPHLKALSRHMMRTIKLNLTFSMTLNFIAVVLALLAVLDPVSGALVHNCGSVLVIINSGLLLGWSQKAN